MTPIQKERIVQWVQHAVSSFNGYPYDETIRQSILFTVRSALASGATVHDGMGEVVVVIVPKPAQKMFQVGLAEDFESGIPDEAIVIDMGSGISAEELQARINTLCSAVVQAVHGLGEHERREIIRGLFGYVAEAWPEDVSNVAEGG